VFFKEATVCMLKEQTAALTISCTTALEVVAFPVDKMSGERNSCLTGEGRI
jgi:hypothetical protein